MNSPLLTLEAIADANFNIIVKIYNLLRFADQLRLAQTSQWLKQIFRAKIWTPSYKTLEVDCVELDADILNKIYTSSDLVAAPSFFNVYEINSTRLCLNREEYTEFLALYANEVIELISCDNYFPDITNFKNITSIKSKAGVNAEQHFKIVTENCRNLQSFKIKGNILSLMIDHFQYYRLNIDNLFKLRHLKILSLECKSYSMQYKQFCDIIRNFNLEYLRILLTYVEENIPEIIHVETPKFLTDLHIHLPNSQLLAWNFNIFENLLRLNLSCEKTISANDWNTFCKAAKCLESITLESLKMPETMETINLPHSLKQVNIENCKNLTDQHLTQIFNLPNLLKFSSIETYYKITTKDILNYKLPPQLQSLNLEGITTFDLLTSLENNQHLKELAWYNYKKNPLFSEDNRLLFCNSLKTLNVKRGKLASDIILRMQNLSKLSLNYETVFKWSDIIALIKHPVLKELYITTGGPRVQDNSSVSELVKGFPINLRVLSIESIELELNLNFWLDLLCQNLSRLKLIVRNVRKDFLKDIVGHKKFPKQTLSTITYDNYILDCKTLQIKFHDKDSSGKPVLANYHLNTLVLGND